MNVQSENSRDSSDLECVNEITCEEARQNVERIETEIFNKINTLNPVVISDEECGDSTTSSIYSEMSDLSTASDLIRQKSVFCSIKNPFYCISFQSDYSTVQRKILNIKTSSQDIPLEKLFYLDDSTLSLFYVSFQDLYFRTKMCDEWLIDDVNRSERVKCKNKSEGCIEKFKSHKIFYIDIYTSSQELFRNFSRLEERIRKKFDNPEFYFLLSFSDSAKFVHCFKENLKNWRLTQANE